MTLTRRRFLRSGAALGVGAALAPVLAGCERGPTGRHIVMISIDDLNDYPGYLGGYGGEAKTPNLDALAASGRAYTSAHASVPICMPSRAAVLFGKQPWNTGIMGTSGRNKKNPGRKTDFGRYRGLLESPQQPSLPRMIASARPDYRTLSMGKVFHTAEAGQWHHQQPYRDLGEIYKAYPSDSGDTLSYGVLPEGHVHQDQQTADWAAALMSQSQEQPLFIGLGFYQPHSPWRLPRWAFDLHPLDSVVVPEYRPEDLDDMPEQAREMAGRPYFPGMGSLFEIVREKGTQAQVVQAYLAAMSHTDRMLGQVLEAIESGPNADYTDILLWSDHGYHLGEKGHWHKRTLWERSTRVPLIVVAPGVTTPGTTCARPVSLLDLYPTLISLSGLKPRSELEGRDLTPLLREPGTDWPHAAITTWNPGNHSIRTERWRYIRYHNG